jgi:hypothetical protein
MSDTLSPPSLLRRITQTPMRDVARGRLTGRLDLGRRIEASGLPEAPRALVRRVVRLTRLWRLEKAEVADELIAHFDDGLAAGETAEALVASFGDERRAAQLIRRAKRRGRPLAWQGVRALGWAFVALLVFYAILAIYFYAGRPTPAVNYLARVNAPIERLPQDERAWPLYRDALAILRERTRPGESREGDPDIKPGGKRWPAQLEWLARQADALELARRGGERPALGFVFGPDGSGYDPVLYPPDKPVPDPARQRDQPLHNVLVPHLNGLRQLANTLASDARAAREQRDGARLVRDLLAINGMGRQLAREPFLLSDLVAIGIRNAASEQTALAVAAAPDLFSDADLAALAHRLSDVRRVDELFDLSGERDAFADVVQRAYTDDGAGGGRMTPEGLRVIQYLGETSAWQGARRDALALAVGPSAVMLVASRAELTRTYDRMMDEAQARLAHPLRELPPDDMEAAMEAMKDSAVERTRYAPILMLSPAVSRVHPQAERYLGRVEGALTGIALELHRRRHGRYPASLDELTPGLLPEVPADRITGDPVRYRLVDGRPVVYSLGADRDDDGGRLPIGRGGEPDDWVAARWHVPPAKAKDGDWVLFPPYDPPDDWEPWEPGDE